VLVTVLSIFSVDSSLQRAEVRKETVDSIHKALHRKAKDGQCQEANGKGKASLYKGRHEPWE
jgi:hypothetical protein